MMFESFGYTMDTMYFSWLENPVDIDKSVELPQFTLERYDLYDCSQNYTAGAFPCLEIKFVLQRAIGFFLIQVYIPSILIVILSWVSFWISIDAIPARVSLGLLTVLTMTTQSTSANNSLPKVSYIKAIDVWMSMCLVFVFVALLEFALVNVISRKGVRTINPARRPPPPPPPQSSIRKLEADGRMEQLGPPCLTVRLNAGAFPCKDVRFVLRRDIGFFMIQVYIPSILIVILSWVSFWINIEASPARVSIGLLTVLTTTTQSTVRGSLPKVSYVKAIDVWMSTCLLFVFASLLEFAVVNVLLRQSEKMAKAMPLPRPVPRRRMGNCCGGGTDEGELSSAGHEGETAIHMHVSMGVLENGRERRAMGKPVDPEGKIKARKIDKLSRKIFPLAFLLFNIVYWIIYAVPDAL
ncbi:hypothetical protein NP493_390g02049 [Ridgeia piscesae]|uniref:Neurotransmitter-gated ion-channel transmembrane domain-containing protein n=1 Tax=Ridgeia piscesae TaxID=27915 RepID=A0AAD9NUY0_RIDPI|nr:hypothetical protein NP493_390g02049 [Ridgeia piscesae]